MMKLKNIFLVVITAGLLSNLPLIYAEDAPIEDLSVENPQGNPQENSSSDEVSMNDRDAESTPQQPVAATPDAEQSSSIESDSSDSAPVQTGSSKERLNRLETQMSNLTRMNMPQQIEELRQEIAQLNGRIQVQEHDIQTMENQQRSFYQDLNQRIQQNANAAPATPITQTNAPNVVTSKDSEEYRAAFNCLVKKDYDNALNGFQNYIQHYPKGTFADGAYYWMGELYLKKNDHQQAENSFQQVISQYPNSNKLPDAKLKIAIIHANAGKTTQARSEFQSIKQQYPNTAAAQLANIQLQHLK